jgi:hypothetical protein
VCRGALAKERWELDNEHHTHWSERGEHHEAKVKVFCILSVDGHRGGKPVRSGSEFCGELRQARIHF